MTRKLVNNEVSLIKSRNFSNEWWYDLALKGTNCFFIKYHLSLGVSDQNSK
jgi:hypothetical protein